MKIFPLASLLILLGCSASGRTWHDVFDDKARSFVTQTESAVIREYGVPDETYEVDGGNKFLKYTHLRNNGQVFAVYTFEINKSGVVVGWNR